MSDVSLGTISVQVGADIKPLQTGVADATKLIKKLQGILGSLSNFVISPKLADSIADIGDVARIVTGDIKGLQDQINSFRVPSQLSRLTGRFKEIGDQAAQAAAAIKGTTDSLSAAGEVAGDASSGFRTVRDTLRAARDAASTGATAFGKLGVAIDATSEATAGAAGAIDEVGAAAQVAGEDAVRAATGFRMLRNEMRASARVGSSAAGIGGGGGRITGGGRSGSSGEPGGIRAFFGGAGKALFDATGVVGALVGTSAYMGAKFQLSTQQIAANSQIKNVAAARTLSLQISNQTGFKPEDVFQALRQISDYNFNWRQTSTIARGSANLALATGSPIAETGQTVASVMREFAIPTSRTSQTIATLLGATQHGNLNLTQFERSFKRAGATTANIGGLSLADSLAAYSTLTQHGYDAAQAATQLRGLAISIAAPTTAQSKGIAAADKKYGLNLAPLFTQQGLSKYGLTGVLNALEPIYRAGDMDTLRHVLPNRRGLEGAAALLGKGHADFMRNAGELAKGSTTLGSNLAGVQNNPLKQLQITIQRFDNMLTQEGPKFVIVLNDLSAILQRITPIAERILNGFARLPKAVQDAILGLAALRAISVFTGIGGVELGTGLRGIYHFARPKLPKLGGLFGLGGAAGIGEAAAGAEGAEAVGGTAAVAGGPVTLAIAGLVAAIAGLAVAWKTNYGQIRDAFGPFLKDFQSTFSGAGASVKDFTTAIAPDLSTIKSALKEFVSFVASTLEPVFKSLFAAWGMEAKRGFDAIKSIITSAANFIEGNIRIFLGVLTGHWGDALKGLQQSTNAAFGAIPGIINALLPGAIKAVKNFASNIITEAMQMGKDFTTGFKNGIASFIPGVQVAVKTLGVGSYSALRKSINSNSPSKVTEAIGIDFGQGFANGIAKSTGTVLSAVRDQARQVTESYRQYMTQRGVSRLENEGAPQSVINSYIAGRNKGHGHSDVLRRAAGARSASSDVLSARLATAKLAGNPESVAILETMLKLQNQHLSGAQQHTIELNLNKQLQILDAKTSLILDSMDNGGRSVIEQYNQPAYGAIIAAVRTAQSQASTASTAGVSVSAIRTGLGGMITSLLRQAGISSGKIGDREATFDQENDATNSAYDSAQTKISGYRTQLSALQSKLSNLPSNTPGAASVMAEIKSMSSLIDQASAAAANMQVQGLIANRQELDKGLAADNLSNIQTQFNDLTSTFQAGGEPLRQYAASLAALVVALKAMTQTKDVSATLRQVTAAAKDAQQQLNAPPAWITGITGSMGSAFGDSFANLLTPQSHRRYQEFAAGHQNNSFLGSLFRDVGTAGRTSVIRGVGDLAGRGFSGLLNGGIRDLTKGGFLGKLFGHQGRAKPTGTKADPLYVVQTAAPNLPNVGNISGLGGVANLFKGKGNGLLSTALSFIPGLGGVSKIFGLASGGVVPGIGFHDSVPAMLTPGERVIPKGQSGGEVHYHHYAVGDIHIHAAPGSDARGLAWQVRRELTTATGAAI